MSDEPFPFRVFMNPEFMAANFAKSLPFYGGDWEVTECEIQHPRYKTYLNPESRDKSFLAIAYHLRARHPVAAWEDQRILYGKAFLGDRSRAEYERACADRPASQRDDLWFLEDLGMFGWVFPDDPAMPWLRELIDPQRVCAHLPKLTQTDNDSSRAENPTIAVEIVNYRPEIRCTARYRMGGGQGEAAIYGKTFADGRGEEVQRRIESLRISSQRASDFAIPPVLGFDQALHTLWLGELAGRPLLDCVDDVEFPQRLEALSKALANLHRQPLSGIPPLNCEEQWQDLVKKAAKLAKAHPRLRETVAALMTELEHHRPDFRQVSKSLIHGDFHIQQISTLEDGRLALFDYDELAMGDPMQDLANFAADLHGLFLEDPRPADWTAALFAAYGAAAPIAADAGRFRWHFQAQLLTRAYRADLQQKPDLEVRLPLLFGLALDAPLEPSSAPAQR